MGVYPGPNIQASLGGNASAEFTNYLRSPDHNGRVSSGCAQERETVAVDRPSKSDSPTPGAAGGRLHPIINTPSDRSLPVKVVFTGRSHTAAVSWGSYKENARHANVRCPVTQCKPRRRYAFGLLQEAGSEPPKSRCLDEEEMVREKCRFAGIACDAATDSGLICRRSRVRVPAAASHEAPVRRGGCVVLGQTRAGSRPPRVPRPATRTRLGRRFGTSTRSIKGSEHRSRHPWMA
jgi:hypothetical protein